MRTAALILAGGRSARAPGPVPKQYARLGGLTVLGTSVQALLGHPAVDAVQVVIGAGDTGLYGAAVGSEGPRILPPVEGGATRQESALRGLLALEPYRPERVLIHDGARPFVTREIVDGVLASLDTNAAAIAAIPLTDSLKRAGKDGRIVSSVGREGLWRAQTPQGFHFAAILAAHRAAAAAGHLDMTDDAAVAEWAGLPVALVAGSEANSKITTAEDLAIANASLSSVADVRTGSGFDVHRLVAGDHIWLCGIKVPHTHALQGHSDADVALHALTDALLGAIGAGDIGQLFPDTDPQWKGAPSQIFVAEAMKRVRARGGRVSNVDVTIVCEAPRVGPHREEMRGSVARMLGIEIERIGIKATTSEGLGFTGRREGIAALAVATVILRPRASS